MDAVVVFTVPMSHLRGIPTLLRERFGVPVVFYDGDVPMSLPEFGGHGHRLQLLLRGRPTEYDLVVSNSEGGLGRLRELGARRAEAVFWGADPELFRPHAVEKERDVFFYGYGDKFRQEWTDAMIGEPSRRLDADFALGGRDFQGDTGRAGAIGDVPFNVFSRVISAAGSTSTSHAARTRPSRVVDCAAVRAGDAGCDDRVEPPRRDRAMVRAGAGAARRRRTPRRRRAAYRELLDDPARRRRSAPARERALDEHTYLHRARRLLELVGAPEASMAEVAVRLPHRSPRQPIAIVPAFNEEENVRVIDEIRAFDRGFESSWSTTAPPTGPPPRPPRRARTSSGCRSTSGSAAPSRPASATRRDGYRLAVRVDGDGQHDPAQLGALLGAGARRTRPTSSSAHASRRQDDGYRSSGHAPVGIAILAWTVSLFVGQRVTDPTSGFQALNRKAIALFAADYPHDYPEVEAALMVHKHQLRMTEVPVQMRERAPASRRSARSPRSTTWSR